jgi:hypothetical protein
LLSSFLAAVSPCFAAAAGHTEEATSHDPKEKLMMDLRFHRVAAAVLLAATLLASPSWGAKSHAPARTGLSTAARVWLLDLFGFGKRPSAKPQPNRKSGCGIDPNGTHCW